MKPAERYSGIATMTSDKQVGGDHYKKFRIQPWDAMQEWFPDSFPDFLKMTAIKYIARDKMDEIEDVRKAIHCLEKWLEVNDAGS